jgi:prepilin-type N-terminal cleavage/methylation domain-containing protein
MLKRSGSGFTIVELLIVVVVIAILAAITIVSYNGITQQAKNTSMLASIDAYTKGLQLYKAQNGDFPAIVSAETGYPSAACLGSESDYPATGPFTSGQCYSRTGSATETVRTSSTLNGQLMSVMSTIPSASTPLATGTASGDTYQWRGVAYSKYGTTAILQYFMPGDQECGRGTKSAVSSYPGTTLCQVQLQ